MMPLHHRVGRIHQIHVVGSVGPVEPGVVRGIYYPEGEGPGWMAVRYDRRGSEMQRLIDPGGVIVFDHKREAQARCDVLNEAQSRALPPGGASDLSANVSDSRDLTPDEIGKSL